MFCKNAEKLFDEYLDNRLSTVQKAALEAHLHDCSACREELAALQATVEQIKSAETLLLPEGFVDRVSSAVRAQAQQQSAKPRLLQSRWFVLRWVAPALGILMIGCLSSYFIYMSRPREVHTLSAVVEERARRAGVHPPGEVFRYEGSRANRDSLDEISTDSDLLDETANAAGEEKLMAKRDSSPQASTSAKPTTLQAQPSEQLEPEALSQPNAGPLPAGVKERSKFGAQARRSGPARGASDTEGEAPLAQAAPMSGAFRLKTLSYEPPLWLEAKAQAADNGTVKIQFRAMADQTAGHLELKADLLSGKDAAKPEHWEFVLAPGGTVEVPGFFFEQQPSVWKITLAKTADKETEGALSSTTESLAKVTIQEYRLFVPSQIIDSPVTLNLQYKDMPMEQAFADLSERTGVVILAPLPFQGNVTLSLNNVSRDTALQAMADNQRLLNYRMGPVSNIWPFPKQIDEKPE